MSDVPEWLQRIRRQAYGSSRDAPRPRPPVQAQEPPPFPFPMRQEPEPDWERERRERRPPTGSVIGAAVGSYRPPPQTPAPPQRNRFAERMGEYGRVVPVQGLMDLGGYVANQLYDAPGHLMRGEPLNTPRPEAPPPVQRRPGPRDTPTNYNDDLAPPPFPFPSGSLAMRSGVSFADVYSPGGGAGRTRSSAPEPLAGRPGRGPANAEYEIDPEWLAANPSPTVSATYGDHMRTRGDMMERNRPLRAGEEPQNTYPTISTVPEYARRPVRELTRDEREAAAVAAAIERARSPGVIRGPLPMGRRAEAIAREEERREALARFERNPRRGVNH